MPKNKIISSIRQCADFVDISVQSGKEGRTAFAGGKVVRSLFMNLNGRIVNQALKIARRITSRNRSQ